MTKNELLKSFEEHQNYAHGYHCPECKKRIGVNPEGDNCPNEQHSFIYNPPFLAMRDMLTAHREAILELQAKVEELEKKLDMEKGHGGADGVYE